MPTTLTTNELPFPAVVTDPDGKHWAIARLLVTEGELLVFGYGDGRVRLEGRAVIADSSTPPARVGHGETRTWTVTDADGGTWYISKGTGCGCSHPLKRANLAAVLNATAR